MRPLCPRAIARLRLPDVARRCRRVLRCAARTLRVCLRASALPPVHGWHHHGWGGPAYAPPIYVPTVYNPTVIVPVPTGPTVVTVPYAVPDDGSSYAPAPDDGSAAPDFSAAPDGSAPQDG